MGQPATPTVYQQPSPQEIAANQASNQQKAAALTKLNQSIFAESRGLRGMGGLYEWAGPTPDLAANMTAANMWRPPSKAGAGGGGTPVYNPGGPIQGITPTPYKPGMVTGGSVTGPPGDRGTTTVVQEGGTAQGTGGPTGVKGQGPTSTGYIVENYAANAYNKAVAAAGGPAKALPNAPPVTVAQKVTTPGGYVAPAYKATVAKTLGLPGTTAAKPTAPIPPTTGGGQVAPSYAQSVAQKTGLAAAPAPATVAPAAKPTAPSTPPPVPVASAPAPIAPVKPLIATPQPKPLSLIVSKTTVKPSLYSTPSVIAQGSPRNV